jgi:hypothetical protein
VVSVTDPSGRIFRFSRQEPLLFYQVAPQFVLTGKITLNGNAVFTVCVCVCDKRRYIWPVDDTHHPYAGYHHLMIRNLNYLNNLTTLRVGAGPF